uniref:Tyrosine decarboxylase n=1 Tax=Trypanosoma congolense (strain IL3000) TaxID=1068625 RepID=G0USG0_TRYCI|nr:conserved hypothetical protein [Trypanosoma congolense IL3000]
MLKSSIQRWGSVQQLLSRSTQFINDLLAPTTVGCTSTPSIWPSSAGAYDSPGQISTRPRDQRPTQHECLMNALRAASKGNFLLDREADVAELCASLTTAHMGGMQHNTFPQYPALGQSLGTLERGAADEIAALLSLPSRFMWQTPLERTLSGRENDTNPIVCGSDSQNDTTDSPTVKGHDLEMGTCADRGGGILHCSTLESLIVLLTTVKTQAHARYLSSKFSSPDDENQLSQRLVLYCSDQSQPLLYHAARCVGIQHIRTLQTVYSPAVCNYPLQLDMLKRALAEDVAQGLYPLLVCGVFGSHVTASVDPLEQMAELCRRLRLWFHVDASHSGLALAARRDVSRPGQRVADDLAVDDTLWVGHALAFERAAAIADSVHFCLSTSFLPTVSSSSTAALLYVSDVLKVDAALRRMAGPGESATNAWCTPIGTEAAEDALQLRLEPRELYATEVIRLSLTLGLISHARVAQRVRNHQDAMFYLQQRLRADGRFDCSVHASCFGMVLLRWLMLADEETEILFKHWSELLASCRSGGSKSNGTQMPRVSIGLVRVQRRTHMCVSLSSPSPGEDGCCEPLIRRSDVDVIVHSLREAADYVSKEGRVV